MLDVTDLNSGYGNLQILWDVSFQVEDGEVVALIGPNGAGKTTVLKNIMGLVEPWRGTVKFLSKDIRGRSTYELARTGIAFATEDRNLFTAMSVLDNLLLGAYCIRDKKKVKKSLEHVFTLFPRLEERKKQYAATMSGGERTILAIARGLMSSPRMLLLDEPSLGLDPQNTEIVFESITKLRKENVTVLLVEQNVNTTLTLADRAYVLEQGRVVMNGFSKDLLNNKHVQEAYLGIT